MSLRKLTRLGLGAVLGMFLPRSGANVDASAQPDLARQLEEANSKIRELTDQSEAQIQAAADRRIAEIFPEAPLPEDETRRPYRPATDTAPGDTQPPSIEDQVAHLDARVEDLVTERAVDDLQGRIDRAAQKFSMANRDRVLMWIAEAGDREVNVEKMMEVSHNHEQRIFDERYNARRAAEAEQTTTNAPPRLPTNPGGVSVEGPKITSANAARTLVERMKKALPHWGNG